MHLEGGSRGFVGPFVGRESSRPMDFLVLQKGEEKMRRRFAFYEDDRLEIRHMHTHE